MYLSAFLLSLISPASLSGTFVTYAYLPNSAVLCDASGEAICTLPATYFVLQEGGEVSGKIPVSYLDLSGYVRAADVEIVDYEPVTKFATLSARPDNDGMAVNLRDKPDSVAGTVLCAVPAGSTLTLYGPREGGELFAGAGRTWQYVRYVDNGLPRYGYIYAPQLSCDAVQPNKIEKVERPSPEEPSESAAGLEMSHLGQIALIAAMCIPAGIVMLVLFYRPDSKREPRHSAK